MSRLEQITPEEMPEVVRIASRLRDEESDEEARVQEHKAFVDAAAEVDLSPEYLERAAAELQQRRIVHARQKLTYKRVVVAGVCTVLAAATVAGIVNRPPPAPELYTFSAAEWKLNSNPESRANVEFSDLDGHKSAAIIHVDSFAPRADGQFFVNLNSPPNTAESFSRYKTASFFLKNGGLQNVRLFLEAGSNERWKSPAVSATANWQQQNIPLTQFEHQIRDTGTGAWHTTGTGEQPGHISNLSFKVGEFMNDASATGDIAVDDLEIR